MEARKGGWRMKGGEGQVMHGRGCEGGGGLAEKWRARRTGRGGGRMRGGSGESWAGEDGVVGRRWDGGQGGKEGVNLSSQSELF